MSNQKEDEILETIKLLEYGQDRIMTMKHRNLILVIGNTGCGKTTLTHFIAGDDNKPQTISLENDSFISYTGNENKVSTRSKKDPCTIFPELVSDTETASVHIDFPGFTISPVKDIVSTYFTRKVIESADNIKIVMLIEFHSLRSGEDSMDFMELCEHVTKFFNDINKYKNSIGLIITKVDELINNKEIIPKVVKFLEEIKTQNELNLQVTFNELNTPLTENDLQMKVIKLIDIMLTIEGGRYSRIFVAPNKPGFDINSVRNEKEHIGSFVRDIKYIQNGKDGICFKMAENSEKVLQNMIEFVDRERTLSVNFFCNEIKRFYAVKYKELTDSSLLKKEVSEKYVLWNEMLISIEGLSKDIDILRFIFKTLDDIDMKVSKRNIMAILIQNQRLQALQNLTDIDITKKSLQWVSLNDILTQLNDLVLWDKFLNRLSIQLSEYDVQSKQTNTSQLIDNTSSMGNETTFLQTLFRQIYPNNETNYSVVNLDHSRKTALAGMLRHWKDNLNVTYPRSDELLIKGTYIRLSQVADVITSSEIKSVTIFALNKIFIDIDLRKVKNSGSLSIMSPVWEVRGRKMISLYRMLGEEEKEHNDDIVRLIDELFCPGETATAFLGIGEEFINGDLLTVSIVQPKANETKICNKMIEQMLKHKIMNAAKKNQTENMEDLVTERDEDSSRNNATDPVNESSSQYIKDYHISNENPSVRQKFQSDRRQKRLVETLFALFFKLILNFYTVMRCLKLKGVDVVPKDPSQEAPPCQNGTRSLANVISLGNKSEVYIQDSFGSYAEDGTDDINAETFEMIRYSFHSNFTVIKKTRYVPENSVFTPVNIINDFKSYLLDNLHANPKLLQFLHRLSENEKIDASYSTLALTDELKGLDDKYYFSREKMPYLPLYLSLQRRIEKRLTNPKSEESSDSYRTALIYLQAAAASTLCSIQYEAEKFPFASIPKYMDLITKSANLPNMYYNNLVVAEIVKDYEEKIDEDIRDVDELTNKTINKSNKIQTKINKQFRLFLNEVAKSEKNRNTLISRKKRLEQALLMKRVQEKVIKVTANFLKSLGSFGKIVVDVGKGKFAQTVTWIFNTDIISQTEKLQDNVISQLESWTDKHITMSNNSNDGKNKTETEILREAHSKICDAVASVALSQEEVELEGKQRRLEMNNRQNFADIIIKICENTGVSPELYREVGPELDTLSEAFQETDNRFIQLKEYETKIHNIILPMLVRLKDKIESLRQDLTNTSGIPLDLTKLDIQSYLKDLRVELKKFTSGFEVEEYLPSIEKLDETIVSLINLYDRIQSYQHQTLLANYIAKIDTNSSFENIQLESAVAKLDKIITSNIILGIYSRVVNSIKQLVFPFADFYASEFALPSTILTVRNTDELIKATTSQIKRLNSKLVESNVSVNSKMDKYIYQTHFDSKHKSTKPFYVWENEYYKDKVADLLKGKEVLLKADVTQGVSQNAVKFNYIEIKLTSIDEQPNELDELLNQFMVKMIHMGNSYYKCNKNCYLMTSDKQTISYSFERNGNNEPVHKNIVYSKLKNGGVMLSPYGMWKIQLLNVTNINFDILQRYNNKVNIELQGYGQYIIDNEVCERNLNKHYNLDRILINNDEMSLIIQKELVNEQTNSFTGRVNRIRRSKPTVNGASSLSSPVNKFFNWIQRKTIGLLNMLLESRLYNSVIDQTNNRQSSMVDTFTQYSVNDTLLLTDLLTRKLTKVKYTITNEEPVNLLRVQGKVLTIITNFEMLIEELKEELDLDIEFDVLNVQRKIIGEIVNNCSKNIVNILFESIVSRVMISENIHLDIKSRIERILEMNYEVDLYNNVEIQNKNTNIDYFYLDKSKEISFDKREVKLIDC